MKAWLAHIGRTDDTLELVVEADTTDEAYTKVCEIARREGGNVVWITPTLEVLK